MIYTRRSLLIIGVAFACALLYRFFPHEGIFQDIISAIGFLVVAPMACARLVLHEKLENFGFRAGQKMTGVLLATLSLGSFIVAFLLLAHFIGTSFLEESVPQIVRESFGMFILYALLMTIYALIYNYFLMGFVVNGVQSGLIVSMLLTVSLFAIINGFSIVIIDAYIGVVFATAIAHYSRSLYYSLAFFIFSTLIINGIALAFLK